MGNYNPNYLLTNLSCIRRILEVIKQMKHFKLLALALMLVLSASSYSQWSYCAGSVNMTGLGTNPGIYCLDANNLIVVGGVAGAPRVFRSTNAGANFTNITGNITSTSAPLFCALMLDANTFIVGDGGPGGAGGNASAWRTTDAGATWTNVLTTGGTGGFFNGIVRANNTANFVIAQSDGPNGAGANCTMYMSTNGGVNWTASQQTGVGFTIGSLPAVYCIDNQFFGNGASTAPRVAWTTNGGTAWTGTAITLTGTFLSGLAFNDNKQNGLAITSGSFPTIARTSTGPGGTWTTTSVGTGTSTLNVLRWVPGTDVCFLATSATTGAIRMTPDNGTTWVSQTTAGLTGFFDISVQNNAGNINGFAVAGDGSVVKYATTPVAVNTNNTTTPTKFALEQNYPNPFNPTTTINYSVPVAGNVTVKIFNTLGVEVMTVVNKNHTVGNFTENVDMSAFSSGVYFYTLSAGDFKETRKMMLVK